MVARTNAQIAAQVAVEAVLDNLDSYGRDTVIAVWINGIANEVPALYLDQLSEAVTEKGWTQGPW